MMISVSDQWRLLILNKLKDYVDRLFSLKNNSFSLKNYINWIMINKIIMDVNHVKWSRKDRSIDNRLLKLANGQMHISTPFISVSYYSVISVFGRLDCWLVNNTINPYDSFIIRWILLLSLVLLMLIHDSSQRKLQHIIKKFFKVSSLLSPSFMIC